MRFAHYSLATRILHYLNVCSSAANVDTVPSFAEMLEFHTAQYQASGYLPYSRTTGRYI